jgi:hypothetical protein
MELSSTVSPPHTSHRLQPLDVRVFGPLQCAWQNHCVIAMDETGEGITWQHVIKHYMLAQTLSFKENTILSAWKKSGISPLNPEVFTQRDFGPSITTSIKPLFPASFQSLLNNGPSEDTGAEEDEDEDGEEDMIIVPNDWSPESDCLNCRVEASDVRASKDLRHNELPILAQAVTNHIPQDVYLSQAEPCSPSESSIPPPSDPPLFQQLMSQNHIVFHLKKEESPPVSLGTNVTMQRHLPSCPPQFLMSHLTRPVLCHALHHVL